MAHILFLTVPTAVGLNPAPVESKLDNAKDWIRFAPNSWLIHTKYSAHTWFRQIEDIPELQGAMIFICEANLEDLSGKLSPFAWDWIKKIRFGAPALAPTETPQPQAVDAA
jgi:hypothetical protein